MIWKNSKLFLQFYQRKHPINIMEDGQKKQKNRKSASAHFGQVHLHAKEVNSGTIYKMFVAFFPFHPFVYSTPVLLLSDVQSPKGPTE